MRNLFLPAVAAAFFAAALWTLASEPDPPTTALTPPPPADAAADADPHRSPVDLVLGPGAKWLVTANQTSSTASLVRTSDGKVLSEAPVGRRPVGIALCRDGRRVLVTGSYGGDLTILRVDGERLVPAGKIHVGYEPYGVAVAPDDRTAYVALHAAAQVAVVDLEKKDVTGRIDVGRWPRYLALDRDGTRLAVGTSGDRGISLVDTKTRRMIHKVPIRGLNIAHLRLSPDGRHVYFPWMMYGGNPPRSGDIRRGWVLGNRLSRINPADPEDQGGMSLDPRGRAMGDPHGVDLSPDGGTLVVSGSGSHELAVFQLSDLPMIELGGSDLMDAAVSMNGKRYRRIPLAGRPLGLRIAPDGQTVYVANYLEDAVQVVDLDQDKVTRTIHLGGPRQPSLVRRGEAIFYDARRSLEGWYSCQSCHFEGGGNFETMDTLNDGTAFTYKTVLPLYHVDKTAPWTWHGWQRDLEAAMHKSLTSTMAGREPARDDLRALVAYLSALEPPPNPHLGPNGSLNEAAGRGKAVFHGEVAGCAECHHGPQLTDGEIHDVGTGRSDDRYQGYNTPSLAGVYRKVALLHDGRAKSLEQLLTGPHDPAKVTGNGPLTADQLRDLIEYLKAL